MSVCIIWLVVVLSQVSVKYELISGSRSQHDISFSGLVKKLFIIILQVSNGWVVNVFIANIKKYAAIRFLFNNTHHILYM